MSSPANPSAPLTPVKRALLEIRDLRTRLEQAEHAAYQPIAIVGMGMRLPGGVSDSAGFWQLLAEGRDALSAVPEDRWTDRDTAHLALDRETIERIRRGGFLDRVFDFDADFFHITPREAESLDPQHRLLLEVVSAALDEGAIAAHSLAGTQTGVFLGLSNSDYGRELLSGDRAVDAQSTVNAWSMAAGRLAYSLNLQGPALVVDTACSSSLVALHLACQSLRARECSLAIAGGANVILSPELNVAFAKSGMLSPTGSCKTFDDAADGYVRSEGCAAVVLKRLTDAVADGNRILAVVRSSAVNHDGRSSGITAPNGKAQERVLREALRLAGLDASRVEYVEAHGTGTALGDPVELEALSRVYGAGRDRPLWAGSLKTNLGHMEAAAGIGGLLKALLALEHETIPAHLHFLKGSRHLDWPAAGLAVPASAVPWPRRAIPRLAGVSSFGFSGTNAHIILEEAPAPKAPAAAKPDPALLCLSAPTKPALAALCSRYREFFARTTHSFADVSYTANIGRSHYRERVAIQAPEQLEQWELYAQTAESQPAIGLIFPGSRLAPAAAPLALLEDFSAFRDALRECGPDALTGSPDVAAFSMEYASARLWMSWGIHPRAVIGQGPGEVAAACIAGIFPPAEALRLLRKQPFSSLPLSPPEIAILSSRTGQIENERMAQPGYWQARPPSPEHFSGALKTAAAREPILFLVLGDALPSAVAARAGLPEDRMVTGSASPLDALSALYRAGIAIDWKNFYRDRDRRKLSLPAYPFQRQTYRAGKPHAAANAAPVLDQRWTRAIGAAERASETGPLGWDVRSYPLKWKVLKRLTVAHIRNVLAEAKAFASPGAWASAESLVAEFGFAARHQRLLERWLMHLSEAGFLQREEHGYRAPKPVTAVDLTPYWAETEAVLANDPPALAYLRRCSAGLSAVVQGRLSALETLFPNGDFTLAEELYQKSESALYLNPIVASAVFEATATGTPSRPAVRILEIGAGTGGTTSAILERLPDTGVDYWFTDVSDAFFDRAQRKLAAYPFVHYATMDLEGPVAPQNAHRFDIIVAANVVHATKNLRHSVAALRELLAPGGLLVLLESTEHFAWFDITTGLIEGWQHFADDLRAGHPLLTPGEWLRLLRDAGFDAVEQYPASGSLAEQAGQHVLLARTPYLGAVATGALSLPETQPLETPLPSAETDTRWVAALQSATLEDRFDVMLDHVCDCLRRVFRLAPGYPLGARDHFTDLGMDSLLALELKAELIKGLPALDLPSSVAFDTGTPGALAQAMLDLLYPVTEPTPARPAHSPAAIEQLSEDQVERLLLERLGAKRR